MDRAREYYKEDLEDNDSVRQRPGRLKTWDELDDAVKETFTSTLAEYPQWMFPGHDLGLIEEIPIPDDLLEAIMTENGKDR